MRKITIYMWGYWGWGNSATELVRAVDAVERKRGFKPPLFVDIRMKRSARPAVFRGNAFGRVVGASRYETMSSLGNEHYLADHKKRLPNSTRQIVIHDPTAADILLDRAVELRKENKHVIYFCACEFPNGNLNSDGCRYACHRSVVSNLLLKCAKKKGIALEVVEWPGGKSKRIDVVVPPEIMNAVRDNRKFVPVPRQRSIAEWAETPWGSLARLCCAHDDLVILTGPAKFKSGKWGLPVLDWQETNMKAKLKAQSTRWCRRHGVGGVFA